MESCERWLSEIGLYIGMQFQDISLSKNYGINLKPYALPLPVETFVLNFMISFDNIIRVWNIQNYPHYKIR